MGNKVELGSRVKDTVTGFYGIATEKCEYLYGTTQIFVESIKASGDEPVSKWFDEGRIQVIDRPLDMNLSK